MMNAVRLTAALLLLLGSVSTATPPNDEVTGSLTGIVKYEGKPIRRKTVRMQGNSFCMAQHGDKPPLEEKYALGKNGETVTVPNVLVYVTKGLEGKTFVVPEEPVVLDQVKCIYTPHVVGVMTGQTLQIRNSDEQLHNVMASAFQNRSFNFGMPKKGTKTEKVFNTPELKVKFQCALHPWMYAYVHVLEHPFFAVTRKDGSFTIRGLPPGEYEISVLHEVARMKPVTARMSVRVEAGQKKNIAFTYRDARSK